METGDVKQTNLERQARDRLYDLLNLQKEIEQNFGSENYNVFIFGSYITVDYVYGVSDVDVAIFSEDFGLYKKVSLYIEEYFDRKRVRSDIFYIDLDMPAPVYLAPLNSKIQFTDFYPQYLEDFKRTCQEALNEIKMRMIV